MLITELLQLGEEAMERWYDGYQIVSDKAILVVVAEERRFSTLLTNLLRLARVEPRFAGCSRIATENVCDRILVQHRERSFDYYCW